MTKVEKARRKIQKIERKLSKARDKAWEMQCYYWRHEGQCGTFGGELLYWAERDVARLEVRLRMTARNLIKGGCHV